MTTEPDRTDAAIAGLSSAARDVAEVMALLCSFRSRKQIAAMLQALGAGQGDNRKYVREAIENAVPELERARLVEAMPHVSGFHRVKVAARGILHRQAVARLPREPLVYAMRLENPPWWEDPYGRLRTDGPYVVAGQLRFALVTETHLDGIARQRAFIEQQYGLDEMLHAALADPDAGSLMTAMVAPIAWWVVDWVSRGAALSFDARAQPIVAWALQRLESGRAELPPLLCVQLATELLRRDDGDGATRAMAGLGGEMIELVRAGLHVRAGEWQAAIAGYEQVFELARLRLRGAGLSRAGPKSLGKDDLPVQCTWYYLLALLAEGSPASLHKLQRFVAGKAGSRAASAHDPWGFWQHAALARQGAVRLDPNGFLLAGHDARNPRIEHLWRVLVLAWCGQLARESWPAPPRFVTVYASAVRTVAERARALGHEWHAQLAEAALAVVRGEQLAIPFFVRPGTERWRDVLQALQALDGEEAGAKPEAAKRRLVWEVTCTAAGAVESIRPLEQKLGVRGWSKGSAIALSRVAGDAGLPAQDAKVARTFRRDPYTSRGYEIDRAAAIVVLVGHTHVTFDNAPGRFVELEADTPEVEVYEEAGRTRLRLTPTPHAAEQRRQPQYLRYGEPPPADTEALRLITVIRDAPQRARVVQYNAMQLRAHLLLSADVAIPEEGRAALQQALRGLARHFRVHADAGGAVRSVPAEVRLRAELSPAGDGLRLRLVAVPLGVDGPRLEPGQGRARLLANVAGEALATERRLEEERAQVAAVLDALPLLETMCASPAPCEWEIDDAELALDVVDTLPRLEAHVGIDWPKGKPVRLQRVDVAQLEVSVRSERDWFRVDGSLAVDETHVLAFEQLLEAARGRRRYVAMGEGVYVALSRALKQRLADLAWVVEHDRRGHHVAPVGAAWLRDLLDGAVLEADDGFRAALDALQQAQEREHALSPMLQALLRGYQEEGYRWAMRLADAGLGGCLADDMGLGKTLQALAVLCARAGDGPALVVAPTSVCGNWMAEAARFAPALRLVDYASADRDAVLRAPSPMDVIVVSYALVLQDSKRFAAHTWHTLVLDEAQAIKNPSAKRSLAIFELSAGFRLALSGTPVENRLAELWSILRFATPGLLGTLGRFNERFAGPIERDRDRERLAVLRRLVAPFVLRRTKSQVLSELPARTETVVNVVPEAREAAHYEALRRDAAAVIDRSLEDGATAAQARFNILAQLMRLRRAACDPRLVSPAFGASGSGSGSGSGGEKVQVFLRIAADLVANGHKALVFSQFVDFLQLLRDALDAEGIRYQTLDGSTPAAERTRRVNSFQAGEDDLFLISLKAFGVGLNLTAADYVVITDPWWNPAVEVQATGRAHRIGQLRPVTVYRLVNVGTIVERIVDLHRDKREIAEGILETGDVAALPSTDVLIGLMRGEG